MVIAVESRNKKEWVYKVAATIEGAESAQEQGERIGNIVPLFREPGPPDAFRLDRAIARVRKLLNDPEALRARANALLDGTAKPLLVLAIVGLTAVRMVNGPATPGYFSLSAARRAAPVTVAAVSALREVS